MERADKLIENIEELMWNDEEGTWFDLEISTLKQRYGQGHELFVCRENKES